MLLEEVQYIGDIQNCNFTCCIEWVWNFVPHTKGRTQIEGIWEQDAEENIWTLEGGTGRKLEKTVLWAS